MKKRILKKLKTIWWMVKSLMVRYFYSNPSNKLKIVGVTGTNGKTTTATLLYKITSTLGYKAGLISTVENLINGEKLGVNEIGPGTTPDSVTLTKIFRKMADAGCEYVFMEVSSHALDQRRVAGINFVGGIFTNLTHDHLDYHKNLDNYFDAKKKFFKMLPARAFALSNIDDKYGKKMLEGIKARKFSYGFKNRADFNDKLETKLLGDFNLYNALAVYASLILLGLEKEKPARLDACLNDAVGQNFGHSGGVKEILQNVEPPKGRFEYFTSKNSVLVVVDYAHTPDALQNVLQTVKSIKKEGTKIISVFGCGGDRDPLKRPIMGKIGAENSDVTIFTSDNSRNEDPDKIIEEMKTNLSPEMLKKVKSISDRREAIREAVKIAQKGDIILCAGKGHEDYQEIKGVKSHFDDMEELKKVYEL